RPSPVTNVPGLPVGDYLQTLGRMAPGDPDTQSETLQTAREVWQRSPTPTNTLRYALALGTPGHAESNPVEASRLLAALLPAPRGRSVDEVRLAAPFQRQFNARVAQYADLARAREDYDAKIRALETDSQARTNAMAADIAKLRKERDAVQQKLDAIAEIERSLMERDSDSAPPRAENP